jgi:hypothetical protein
MPLAQNGGNTRLGRNWGTGIIRGVRPLVFVQETGFRNVDPNATWIPGQFVTLDSQGRVTAFQLANDRRIGIAKTSKGAPFYLPYTQELEWGAVNDVLSLDKSNVKDVRIVNASGTPLIGGGTHYTVLNSGTNGTIQVNSNTSPAPSPGAFVRVTYQYKDMDHAPFDQTLASGKAALFESNGEYAFEVYDTSVGYAVGNYVKLTAEGIITIETDPSTPTVETVGFVTRAPSADDVTLGVKITVF